MTNQIIAALNESPEESEVTFGRSLERMLETYSPFATEGEINIGDVSSVLATEVA